MTNDRDKLDLRWRRGNLLAGLALTGLCSTVLLSSVLGPQGRDSLYTRASQSSDDHALPVQLDKVRSASLLLDPNTASAAALELLPDVGPIMARDIVTARQEARDAGNDRPFKRLGDMAKIKGIGPTRLRKLAPYLALPE